MDSPSPEEAARRAAVMRHHEPVDGEDPWVGPPPPAVPIRVVAYDAAWPAQFHEVAAGIRADPAEVPQVNLHVFAPGCPGAERHRMFREWLRAVPADREEYRDAKLAAAAASAEQSVTEYNRRKEPVIRAIYGRMFRAAGWFDDPQTTSSR